MQAPKLSQKMIEKKAKLKSILINEIAPNGEMIGQAFDAGFNAAYELAKQEEREKILGLLRSATMNGKCSPSYWEMNRHYGSDYADGIEEMLKELEK